MIFFRSYLRTQSHCLLTPLLVGKLLINSEHTFFYWFYFFFFRFSTGDECVTSSMYMNNCDLHGSMLISHFQLQGKRVLERAGSLSTTREAHFIESFPALCSRVVISHLVMEEEENPYMALNLLMKTSN